MSSTDEDARPYLDALNEQVSDLMAEQAMPQLFWPAQVVRVKPALPPTSEDHRA